METIATNTMMQDVLDKFPYLPRLWGRARFDELIARGKLDQYITESSRSPYQIISKTVEQEFPRLYNRLLQDDHEVMVNVLVELTITCYPGIGDLDLLTLTSVQEPDPHELACAIGRYLHRFL